MEIMYTLRYLEEKKENIILNYVVPISGAVIAIGLNLTPAVLFYELKTNKKKYQIFLNLCLHQMYLIIQ